MPNGHAVRPVFFAPWWWFVWANGKRFSLRRAVSIAALVTLLAEIIFAAAQYAFNGKVPAIATALPIAELAALASAAYSLLEPALFVLRDTTRARSSSPGRLRDVSYGLQTAYAAAIAFGAYEIAPHVAYLGHLLAYARSGNGWWGGTARFLLGGTLIALPFVIALRFLLMRTPQPRPYVAPQPQARETRHSAPFVDRTKLRPPPRPPEPQQPSAPMPQAPARIVSVDVRPKDPKA